MDNCTVSSTESEDVNNRLFLFPNPTSQAINISGLTYPFDFEIFDSIGKLVLKKQSYQGTAIDLKHLSTGIYWIQIQTDGIEYQERFIIN